MSGNARVIGKLYFWTTLAIIVALFVLVGSLRGTVSDLAFDKGQLVCEKTTALAKLADTEKELAEAKKVISNQSVKLKQDQELLAEMKELKKEFSK